MTISTPPGTPRTELPKTEALFVETLRQRYEDRGYAFVVHPPLDQVPDFFLPFVPDAIAQKPGSNIVVEVKLEQGAHDERSVADLRRRFAGHPDWALDVVYLLAGEPKALTIPSAEASLVREQMAEVSALGASGHAKAAFLLSWSVLEAALNTSSGKAAHRPRSPGEVVQWLAMNGRIEPEKEPRLRALGHLRNRLAHGDLSVEPTPSDVEFIAGAVRDSLMDAAA